MHAASLIITFFFLFGAVALTGFTTALLKMGRIHAKEEFKRYRSLFFYQHLMKHLFGQKKWEGLFFTLSFSKHALHLLYVLAALFLFVGNLPFVDVFKHYQTAAYIVALVFLSLAADLFTKWMAVAYPALLIRFFSLPASCFLALFSPITALFFKLTNKLLLDLNSPSQKTPSLRDRILELLYESELSSHLDPTERKLVISVASFKERIVREVMVPRIDVFTLSEEASLIEAAQAFLREGYSRIPVYRENVDYICGVLLYKDVMAAYISQDLKPPSAEGEPRSLSQPLKNLIKPVLYTPETKKISLLLQEFRSKQIHLAIVVDEYGGTEGIITIEDILEELVGEIADEYDTSEELLFSALPSGGWIVDARMNILDIEKELGIQIPQSPEYDTLGGYIFHRAGSIPSRGWRIHHDAFDLEILSSDDRSIEKVRITPFQDEVLE